MERISWDCLKKVKIVFNDLGVEIFGNVSIEDARHQQR